MQIPLSFSPLLAHLRLSTDRCYVILWFLFEVVLGFGIIIVVCMCLLPFILFAYFVHLFSHASN